MREAIEALVSGRDLTESEAAHAMEMIMSGEASPALISAFLVALRMKGETADELTGLARVMRDKALKVRCSAANVVDTCGTGGDGLNTFNVSTAAAFVAAGAGVPVAKHGNRSVSSRCGSADVLEALGVQISASPEQVAQCIDEVGIGFMFAPAFHPAMRHAAPVRRELGIRTAFNLLGPLTNPADARRQVIGVPRPDLTRLIAEVLLRLGFVHAFVVHGHPGIDELSTAGPTTVSELRDGAIRTYSVDAADLGIPRADLADIAGRDAKHNGDMLLGVLSGKPGPVRDIVLLNAAAALVVGGAAEDIRHGIQLAAQSIDEGAASAKLEALRRTLPA